MTKRTKSQPSTIAVRQMSFTHLATMDRAGVVRAADFRLQSFLVHILYPELHQTHAERNQPVNPAGTSTTS
ncbi:hypothetical protein X732_30970 [Mesorhizobium sp. L2C066B000]|nr:hypothetical protein X732_30970 [Mesorhizobium sp. L2C066B000]